MCDNTAGVVALKVTVNVVLPGKNRSSAFDGTWLGDHFEDVEAVPVVPFQVSVEADPDVATGKTTQKAASKAYLRLKVALAVGLTYH